MISCLLGVLMLMPFLSRSARAQETPHPAYTIDLSSLVPEGATPNANGSVAFLTDKVVAVGICYKAVCNLQTFDLADGSPRQLGQRNGVERFHAILRSGDGGLLLAGVTKQGGKGAILFDQRLTTSQWIPAVPGVSVRGEKIPEGQGRLLAHTDDLAAYLDQSTIRIKNASGNLLGSFETGLSKGKPSPTVVFLGKDRILYDSGASPEVRDFKGAVLRKVEKPRKALGERIKQSQDGALLLYDSFTRRVGAAQTVLEDAMVVPSMGMSTDGDVPNGETVQVVNTGSGKACFEWYGGEKLLPPFVDHADITPSGQLVAIMTQGTLAIFHVAESSTGK